MVVTSSGIDSLFLAFTVWGSSGVCAQYIMEQSRMSSQFLTMIRLLFAGLILVTFSFMHG
ncbi:EamA family transporter, partial [Salmonella enterica subsp. enterica serovar Montevideo]|nr:EamA family transporter [Salmonella enterica subsp. enterica serovar Montevideo]